MTFLLVMHATICLILVAVILLQPGKSDMGINFGSNSQSIFGSKAASNFLTKVTTICAVLFLLTSFSLTKIWLSSANSSVIGNEEPAAEASPTTEPKAAAPSSGTPATEAPKANEGK